ncbi:hypothetical protein Celaphus_00005781 [Cervus elaphus hippelaphus]|uniref:Uncharacterized protein n=1 Tax=Cervus elaphus hippelaphus TaxID=46360 RepID=A0A212CW76_CEREH|nr:hypothetical protein Celaphus_00005781 [Cervus elaphus hippelaphus]
MDSLALRKRMLPPSTKMAAYAVSLRPWPLSNTLLSFILASLLTGMAPIPKTVGLIKLGKQSQELASYLEIAHSAMNSWVSGCEP